MYSEDLGQAGDAEDLQYPLLRADQIKRSVVRTDPLEPANEDAEARGVKKLHLFHVHDDLVVSVVHQVDQELTQPWRGVHIDLAFYVDDLDSVLVVVIQLQIHRFLQRHASIIQAVGRAAPVRHAGRDAPSRIQPCSDSCLYQITVRGTRPADDKLLTPCLMRSSSQPIRQRIPLTTVQACAGYLTRALPRVG